MKIVDAVWEKRNLGVDVTEIVCEASDSKEELISALSKVKAPYSVCKVPSGAVELLLCAQEQGYQVIEMSIGMEREMKDLELPSMYKGFASDIIIKDANDRETKLVLERIESGNIFKTDRIAMDPYFGKKIAGKRYGNWIRDLIQKDAHMCIGYYREEPVAFGVTADKEGQVSNAVFGGLLNTETGKGLGFISLYANLVSAEKRGNKKIKTYVSSNNPAVITLHLRFGYSIAEMQYVLIKHQ